MYIYITQHAHALNLTATHHTCFHMSLQSLWRTILWVERIYPYCLSLLHYCAFYGSEYVCVLCVWVCDLRNKNSDWLIFERWDSKRSVDIYILHNDTKPHRTLLIFASYMSQWCFLLAQVNSDIQALDKVYKVHTRLRGTHYSFDMGWSLGAQAGYFPRHLSHSPHSEPRAMR